MAEFESVDDLVDFLRKAGYHLPVDRARTAPLSRSSDPAEGLYVAIGEVLGQKKGIPSEQLARAVGVGGSRGLSGCSRVWAQILRGLGFEMGDVFLRVRRGKSYFWLPGPKLQQANEAMERARVEGKL